MKQDFYEKLKYPDSSFPVIYHFDTIEDIPQQSIFYAHWHDSIEILYFTKGSAYVKCDNKLVQANVGDVIIVNANQLHSIKTISKKCQYNCFIISHDFFDKNELNIYTTDFTSKISDDIYLTDILDEIIVKISNKKSHYKMLIKGDFFYIFAHLLKNYLFEESSLSKQRTKLINIIKTSIVYIESNYQNQITLDLICTQVSLSKYYFCRIFKEIIGISPIEYLNIIRIDKAYEILQSGKYNVSETAELCGFNNINYFSKVFKRYKNILPSSIRKL